jgi:transposase InsO family protein
MIDALYLEDPSPHGLAGDLPETCTIPLQKGFLYLVAIMNLHSRHGLSWRLSNSLDTEFCLEALEMALEGGRKPEVFQFRSGLPVHHIRLRGQTAD